MKLFGAYIRQRGKMILLLVFFFIVFGFSFILYHLPLKAIGYPFALCAFFAAIFLVVDFQRVKGRHRQLSEMRTLPGAMLSDMPEAAGIEEWDYQEAVKALQKAATDMEAAFTARCDEIMEYYTVWVHQIKTPITSMRLTLQREDTPLSRKLSSDLLQIEGYVEMALVFMRLDSDSSDYVIRKQDIDGILKQAIAKFASEFIDREIRLVYEPIKETAVTDEKWFSFVVEQILSNALKYTRKGSIRICMRGEKTLCIEDTGIGISPEDLPRIFEKGYTGGNGRLDKRASGIGLYLCKRICDKLEIGLHVASELGKGTAVSLDLAQYQLKKE